MVKSSTILLLNILITNIFVSFAWRSKLFPDIWDPGYTTEEGLFFHDFSYTGYKKGEEPIPEKMEEKYVDVTKSPYNADSSGGNDATQAIQNAINDVEKAGGGTIFLPEGIYKVKPEGSNTYALRISASNILW